jgi:hypothetical protein
VPQRRSEYVGKPRFVTDDDIRVAEELRVVAVAARARVGWRA